MAYSIRFVQSIHAIGKNTWQSLLQTDYPFLRFEFLAALEDTNCIDSDFNQPIKINNNSGWIPYYALLEKPSDKSLLAIAPIFIKQHSYGEYVFDWTWADAYQHHGLNYYPKLVWAIPFTPTSGPRIISLGTPDQLAEYYQFIAHALSEHCRQSTFSGWHCLFPNTLANQSLHPEGKSNTHKSNPVSQRISCQFHWFNEDGFNNRFKSFSHYLETFNSRKRKNINKERRKLREFDFSFQSKSGNEITEEDIHVFYHCYQLTYAKRNMRGYLSLEFFLQLLNTMPEQLFLVQAQRKQSNNLHTVASALYFKDQNTLYGRYWGCLGEYDCLHFECCYYQGIEFCIDNNLERFDPGTQGEHKISRGFEPTICYSQHWLAHPQFSQAIDNFTQEEAFSIKEYQQQARRHLPFKQGANK